MRPPQLLLEGLGLGFWNWGNGKVNSHASLAGWRAGVHSPVHPSHLISMQPNFWLAASVACGLRAQSGAAGNQQSLYVSYLHLSQAYLDLAVLVPDCPNAVLPLFHKAARDAVLADFPEYRGIHEEVFVRITELPIEDSIRELRCAACRAGRPPGQLCHRMRLARLRLACFCLLLSAFCLAWKHNTCKAALQGLAHTVTLRITRSSNLRARFALAPAGRSTWASWCAFRAWSCAARACSRSCSKSNIISRA